MFVSLMCEKISAQKTSYSYSCPGEFFFAKDWFLSKISIFEENFDVWPNFGFWGKFRFLRKISMFDQIAVFEENFDFWGQFRFLNKISIFA